MSSIASWPGKVAETVREDGFFYLLLRIRDYCLRIAKKVYKRFKKGPRDDFYDVLFINGCDYSVPHPIRYRVDHQIEQLTACGISAESKFYLELQEDDVRLARNFIIFRCPYTETVGAFISAAKALNKRVYFDVDDLVIDRKYTDTIKYLDTMSAEERRGYDDCVDRMGKTLRLCDAAITTTERLSVELQHYVGEVFINRNTASEEMHYLSERAIYYRDVLPHLPQSQVRIRDRKLYKNAIRENAERQAGRVSIGYFSGSITHNDDFLMILPSIVRVMEERPNVRLIVVGDLDLPEGLESYRDRVTFCPFTQWERLPRLIAGADINLAPLEESIFNEAKSENKWVEASLVKVPTIASDIGAFSKMMVQGETGVLCDTPEAWYDALMRLIDNANERKRLAENAYAVCTDRCLTINSGYPLASYIQAHQSMNIGFVLPSLKTSGGVLVAIRHCAILQAAGYDVTLLNTDDNFLWEEADKRRIPVLNREFGLGNNNELELRGRFDKLVATFWDTLKFCEFYPNKDRIFYFVQNYEPDFYEMPDFRRALAAATYNHKNIIYGTMSLWCKNWLKGHYGKEARYVSNGIDLADFPSSERTFKGKTRILIEGDSEAEWKNVDESFRIVDKLDPDEYEVWYMSYNGKPKSFYRVDKFLGSVPHDEVASIYLQCHILLKTSILESFSYPPLEMMATGGFCVVLPNEGNAEYLVDGENCLMYQRGKLDDAVLAIERIRTDITLRAQLRDGGLKTARRYDWKAIESDVVSFYD